MTFKNVTRAYDTSDPNMRTADQLSQEEQDALTEEQKEEINRNTILKRSSEAQTQFDISAVLFLQPSQNGTGLLEPGAELRADGKENNEAALEPRLAIDETVNVKLYFKLANQSDVQINYIFTGMTQLEDNSFTEEFGDNQMSQEVTFARAGQTTPQLWAYLTTHSFDEGQSTNNVEWHGLKIPLRDGWYVDKQGNAAITLKNPNKEKASIEFSYSSGQTAQQYAQETANWATPAPEVTTTTINGTTYYTYTNGNTIVLCRDLPSSFNDAADSAGSTAGASAAGSAAGAGSIRIALTNLSLDEARPFL